MASLDINNNNNVELYDRNVEHPLAVIAEVCKLLNEEKARRMGDAEGENNKRVKALQLSELFQVNFRETWFQRGSSFVLGLLSSVRTVAENSASNVTSSISNAAGSLGQKAGRTLQHKAEEVGIKAIDQAQVLGAKAQQAAADASLALADKAGNAGLVIQEQAQNLTSTIAQKGAEGVNDIQAKGAVAAQSLTSIAQSKALDAKSFLSDKVQNFASKIKGAVGLSISKNSFWSFSDKTSLSFAIMEQEAERTRRMNDIDEILVIRNAMQVAALIKRLGPALYRPAEEPTTHYTARLLEEAERSRRVSEVQSDDKASINNAKNVAALIDQKFNNQGTQFPLAAGKIEQADVVEVKKPFVAAM